MNKFNRDIHRLNHVLLNNNNMNIDKCKIKYNNIQLISKMANFVL